MKKIIAICIILSICLSGLSQNTLFGNGGYNIQTHKFYLNSSTDSIARFAKWGTKVFTSLRLTKDSVPISGTTDGMYILVIDTTATADSNKVKRVAASTFSGAASLASTQIGVGDGSNLLSGSSAYTYDGTTVQQVNSGATNKVINNASLSTTSGAASALYTYNTPTASTDQIGVINFGSAGAGSNNYIGASIGGFANGAWTGGSSHFGRLVFSTTNSGSATPSEVMRISNGRVSIGTSTTGTAYLTLRGGGSGSNAAPLKFVSGTLQTTPEAGTMEYDGTNFYLSPSTTRKRIPLYTDATPTSGSVLVGNGTDFTLQNLGAIIKDSTGYYTVTGTTADATPTNIAVIPVSIGYVISIEATCIAITADGDDAFSGIKHRAYHKTSGGTLTSLTLTTIAPDAYVGGGLSTATFTLTNSGTDAAIQVTGEAATTINWKIRYKLVSINVSF